MQRGRRRPRRAAREAGEDKQHHCLCTWKLQRDVQASPINMSRSFWYLFSTAGSLCGKFHTVDAQSASAADLGWKTRFLQ